MHRYPNMYEINARIFLRRSSEKYHQTLTLSTVPDEEWQILRHKGFDLIWLMGVWQRSPGARQKALSNPALRGEYDQALPDWGVEDIDGSPYAVYTYTLDTALGSHRELGQLRSRLNCHDLGLILDFVPNHLALDHPWTILHPDRFVQGKEDDVHAHPDWFFLSGDSIYLAHGRDPNFPPWTDTVQVNYYSTDLRKALIEELLGISEVADGVRCDMAMLALNSVFQRVWGDVVKDYIRLETEFWTEAIEQVKRKRPAFLFLAEVYWGLEKRLQEMGFDFTYDKLLYDRLRFASPDEIQSHLMSDDLYQQHSVRFIENHDEIRAIAAFGRGRSLAAAIVVATVPGLHLFHDGQLEGRNIRLPVQLVRERKEADDPEIKRFYDNLVAIYSGPAFHRGEWMLIESRQAWKGNESHKSLLAWCWRYMEQVQLVVVNYSPNQAQGWLKLPIILGNGGSILVRDELAGVIYTRDADELRASGLYVDLGPWQAHILVTL